MTQPVIIPFQVEGVDRVLGAFRTIKDALRDLSYISQKPPVANDGGAARAAGASARDAMAAERQRTAAAEREADRRLKLELANIRASVSMNKQSSADAAMLERQKTSVAEAEAKRRHQAEVANIRAAAALKAQELANAAASERQQTSVVQRELDRRMMIQRQAMASEAQLQQQRMADAAAMSRQRLAMHEREAARQHQADRASSQQWANTITGSIRSTVGTMVGLAGAAMALGGGFTLTDAVQSELSARGAARELSIQSGARSLNPEERAKSLTDEQILATAKAASVQTGYKLEEIIVAMQATYNKSGDVAATRDMTPFVAQISRAFGVDLKDTSTLAGTLIQSGRSMSETQDALRTIFAQGRAGSIDPKDLAGYAARLVAASEHFSNRNEAIVQLGAMLQLSPRGGDVNAAEATTSMGRMAERLGRHEDYFRDELGVEVSADHRTKMLSDPLEIMRVLIPALSEKEEFRKGKKGKENLTAFVHDKFGEEGAKFVMGLYNTFNRGRDEAFKRQDAEIKEGKRKPGDIDVEAAKIAGMQQLEAALKPVNSGARAYTNEQMQAEAASRTQAVDIKIAAAYEELRQAVGEQLVPELVKLVPILKNSIPHIKTALEMFAKALETFNEHPIASIGGIIIAKVGADLAGAAIGAAVSDALVASIAGSGLAASLAGPIAAIAGPMAAVAIAAGFAAYFGKKAIDDYFDKLGKEDATDAEYPAKLEAQRQRIAAMPDSAEKAVMQTRLIEEAQRARGSISQKASTTTLVDDLAVDIASVSDVSGGWAGASKEDVIELWRNKKRMQQEQVARIDAIIGRTKSDANQSVEPAAETSSTTWRYGSEGVSEADRESSRETRVANAPVEIARQVFSFFGGGYDRGGTSAAMAAANAVSAPIPPVSQEQMQAAVALVQPLDSLRTSLDTSIVATTNQQQMLASQMAILAESNERLTAAMSKVNVGGSGSTLPRRGEQNFTPATP